MKISKFIILVLIVVALIGFADSGYLTWKHYSGAPAACGIIEGCDKVLASVYSTIGEMPVALFGLVYYGFLLYLLSVYLVYKNPAFLKMSVVIAFLGFLVSLWFVYLQIFVIKAFCFYCLISAFSSTAIFLFLLFWRIKIIDKKVRS